MSKNVNKNALFSLALFMLAAPHAAHADAAFAQFGRIYSCIISDKPQKCRDQVTAASVPYFDRFTNYGLSRCIPENAEFDSAEEQGSFVMIRARASKPTGEGYAYGRFYFAEEEGELKFDVPETLRRSMGENWEKNLRVIEQGYLMLKSQMGDGLGCDAIRALAAGGSKR